MNNKLFNIIFGFLFFVTAASLVGLVQRISQVETKLWELNQRTAYLMETTGYLTFEVQQLKASLVVPPVAEVPTTIVPPQRPTVRYYRGRFGEWTVRVPR